MDEKPIVEINKSIQTVEQDKLLAALSKTQGSLKVAKKGKRGHFGEYADLSSVVRASREALVANGLSVNHRLETINGVLTSITRLGHCSGQWLDSHFPVFPADNKMTTLGSALTYLRRFAYTAIVGVVPSDGFDDSDDDGEMVSKIEKTNTNDKFFK